MRQLVREYVEHYHGERNHQGLDNKLVVATTGHATMSGRVLRRQRLGGVLNHYHRGRMMCDRPMAQDADKMARSAANRQRTRFQRASSPLVRGCLRPAEAIHRNGLYLLPCT
jgi:hypothetical protein